jgi:hypothetical protein
MDRQLQWLNRPITKRCLVYDLCEGFGKENSLCSVVKMFVFSMEVLPQMGFVCRYGTNSKNHACFIFLMCLIEKKF